ncbi:Hypothetical predicted protein [Olea europaea subsp. europaea]|uniref:CRIB domain-containing protein n=1 Tax=Olea europaea subsp. europaea TaxID=158383 RepID=A0A8S0TWQ4_OLEEU|nr:Hypothetical predicted protein [Olea europaea subsp. europaea]
MGTKMIGIYKGFKYTLSKIFVVKEREMEIGFPTDVKHVAHIGWDGPSSSAPSWMNEFKTGPDFAATSIGNSGSALSPWSSQGWFLKSLFFSPFFSSLHFLEIFLTFLYYKLVY